MADEQPPKPAGKTLSDVADEPAQPDPFKGGRAKKSAAVIVALLAIAAIGFREPIARKLVTIRSEFAEGMESYSKPKPPPPELPNTSAAGDFAMRAGAPAAVPETPAPGAPATFTPPAPVAAPAPPAPKLTKRPDQPARPAPGHTKIYGVVYDMRTGVATAGAKLTFRGPNDLLLHATTDERGLYEIDVPWVSLDGGVSVGVEAPGFRPGGLEDGEPSWFERPAADVKSAIEELAPSDLEPSLIRTLPRAEYRPLDLVVIAP